MDSGRSPENVICGGLESKNLVIVNMKKVLDPTDVRRHFLSFTLPGLVVPKVDNAI